MPFWWEALVWSLTCEKGDAATLDVPKCFQCSRGRSYVAGQPLPVFTIVRTVWDGGQRPPPIFSVLLAPATGSWPPSWRPGLGLLFLGKDIQCI